MHIQYRINFGGRGIIGRQIQPDAPVAVELWDVKIIVHDLYIRRRGGVAAAAAQVFPGKDGQLDRFGLTVVGGFVVGLETAVRIAFYGRPTASGKFEFNRTNGGRQHDTKLAVTHWCQYLGGIAGIPVVKSSGNINTRSWRRIAGIAVTTMVSWEKRTACAQKSNKQMLESSFFINFKSVRDVCF